jgi:hypothetical protein
LEYRKSAGAIRRLCCVAMRDTHAVWTLVERSILSEASLSPGGRILQNPWPRSLYNHDVDYSRRRSYKLESKGSRSPQKTLRGVDRESESVGKEGVVCYSGS